MHLYNFILNARLIYVGLRKFVVLRECVRDVQVFMMDTKWTCTECVIGRDGIAARTEQDVSRSSA